MAVSLTVNGVAYSFPNTGDNSWGDNVTNWATAITNGTLQKAGGAFTLTADVNFGNTFGLVSGYYKSYSSNIAAAGVFRFAVSDTLNFRNNANSGDLAFGVNGSDQLLFNGNTFVTTTGTLGNSLAVTTNGSGVLTTSGTSTTATELGFVHGVTSAIQTQINSKQATLTTGNLTVPASLLSVSGGTGAIIGSGAAITLGTQSANTVLAGPTSGSAATPTFRAISPIDLPLARNFLINSGFDFWQRGTSVAVTSQANPATPTYLYEADRWYVNNILGGGTVQGIITFSQVTGVTNGSKFGAKVQITTAPTGTNKQNGCELYQTLENLDSIILYGQTASFSVLVKAFGNVNQVGVQFFYKTTEARVDTAIGSEVLTTVNSSTFTACTISGQALGTTQTTSGVIGVRIRITGVSTLNLYDVNNGFVVEQAQLNVGSTVASWQRAGVTIAEEKRLCQRFYQLVGAGAAGRFYTTTDIAVGGQFSVEPRAPASLTISSIGTATVTEVGVGNKTSSSTPSLSTTAASGYYMTCAGFTGATSGNTAVGITDFMIVSCEI